MLICDWCRLPIEEADFSTIEFGGTFTGGARVRHRVLTYHTNYRDDDPDGRLNEFSCFGKVRAYLDVDRDFASPDNGMEWRLIPRSERANDVYAHNYRSPAIGTTPLETLDLPGTMYERITQHGVFTVEHLVDARSRGENLVLRPKTLARLDAILLERGLLPAATGEREAG